MNLKQPAAVWKGMEKKDRYVFLSALLPIIFWWIYFGRHKYGMKGMK